MREERSAGFTGEEVDKALKLKAVKGAELKEIAA